MGENAEYTDGVACEQVVELNAVCDGGDLYSEYNVLSSQCRIYTNMNRNRLEVIIKNMHINLSKQPRIVP